MRRRSLIAALASTTALGLGGCATRGGPSKPPAGSPSPSATATTDEPSPATTTATPRRGAVPADRVVAGEALAEDGIAVSADRWFGLDRVVADVGGDTRTLTPTGGWFVAYEFTVRNRGASRASPLPDSVFTLRIDDATYHHRHELPGGVPFDALEAPPDGPRIRELAWYDGLDPGESASLQLVFEAPVRPDFRHYLAWAHDAPVEGGSAPVYLAGRRVRTAG